MRDTRGAQKAEREFFRRWEDRQKQAEKRAEKEREQLEADAHDQPAR
jgi:hypothetical protein